MMEIRAALRAVQAKEDKVVIEFGTHDPASFSEVLGMLSQEVFVSFEIVPMPTQAELFDAEKEDAEPTGENPMGDGDGPEKPDIIAEKEKKKREKVPIAFMLHLRYTDATGDICIRETENPDGHDFDIVRVKGEKIKRIAMTKSFPNMEDAEASIKVMATDKKYKEWQVAQTDDTNTEGVVPASSAD